MSARDLALAVLVMALWGFNYIAVKWAGVYLPSYLSLAMRFAIVAVFVFAVPLPVGRFGALLTFGVVLGVFNFGAMIIAMREVDASTAAILLQSQVPMSTLLGAILYRERPKRRDLVGIVIALAGTAIIAGQPQGGSSFGIALLLGAALAWSIANMLAKRLASLPPLAITAWSSLFMLPIMLVESALFDRDFGRLGQWSSWRGYLGVVYMGLASSVAAYGLWFALLRRVPLPKLTPTVLLTPIFAVAAGVMILGEQITPRFALGALLTLAGLAIVMIKPGQTTADANRSPAPDQRDPA